MIKMNTKNAAKQCNFIIKGVGSVKYSGWFKEAKVGLSNGLTDLKKKELRGLKIEAVRPRRYGERLLTVWLKRYSPQEQSWRATGLADLPSPELVRKSFTVSLSKEKSKIFPLFPPSPIYSLNMGKQAKLSLRETAIISLIHMPGQRRWEISTRQTLSALDISEAQRELHAFILFTPLMLPGIPLLQASLKTSRPFLCASILLMRGNLWGFRGSRRWTTRWRPPA